MAFRSRPRFGEVSGGQNEQSRDNLEDPIVGVLELFAGDGGRPDSPAENCTGRSEDSPGRTPVGDLAIPRVPSDSLSVLKGELNQQDGEIPLEIRCPVCLDPFSSPVTLSCNHNLCREHILDLASTNPEGCAYNGPDESFSVRCPKCRQTSTFNEGEKSVQVNHEMRVMVEMMLRLLAQHRSEPVPSSPTVPSQLPPALRGRQSSFGDIPKGRRRVRFEEEGGAGATPEGSSEVSPGKTTSPAARHRMHIQNAQNQLLALEKQLEDQRERLRKGREDAAQLKTAQYKRERQEEILRRRNVSLLESHVAQLPYSSTSGDQEGLVRAPNLVRGGSVWILAEEQFLAVKRDREQRRDEEREARERAIKAEIEAWKRDIHPSFHSTDDGELERHLRAIDEYTAATSVLSSSAKAREAEGRLHDVGDPVFTGRQASPKGHVIPTLGDVPEYDDEVERRLWDVELRMNRDRDEELSRARMAEVAEERARSIVKEFNARRNPRPPSASYVPKMNRLQRF